MISTFTCILDLNTLAKYCQSHFFICKCKNQGVKITVVFRQISPYVGVVYPFQILIGSFQNLLNKALRKSWMLGYFKCGKY